MTADVSKNTIALLLILALIIAGIGVGIAINNYQTVNAAAYKEITVITERSTSQAQVGIIVQAPEEGENTNG